MKITKRWLKKWRPCREAIDWLNEQDIKDVFKLIKRLRQSDINDKYGWLFWAIPRLLKTHRDRVRFAVYAAWLVLPEFEKECPDDKRPRETLSLVKKWLKNPGNVSDGELRHAAWAAWAAEAAEATRAAEAAGAAGAAWAAEAAWAAGAAWAAEAAWAAGVVDPAARSKIINYGVRLLREGAK